MKRRYGRFTVQAHMVEDHPEEFARILWEMKFVPMRVERIYSNYGFDYIGYSPMFAEVPEGMVCPDYELVVKIKPPKEEGGLNRVKLEMVQPVAHSMMH